jgi:hypothetical protein
MRNFEPGDGIERYEIAQFQVSRWHVSNNNDLDDTFAVIKSEADKFTLVSVEGGVVLSDPFDSEEEAVEYIKEDVAEFSNVSITKVGLDFLGSAV